MEWPVFARNNVVLIVFLMFLATSAELPYRYTRTVVVRPVIPSINHVEDCIEIEQHDGLISAAGEPIVRNLLVELLFSFCPKSVRRRYGHLDPTTLPRIATLTGLLQMTAAVGLWCYRFVAFFALQKQQWGYHLIGETRQVQAVGSFLILADYLLQPLSLIVAYLAVEGFARFLSAIMVGDIVPSLPVVLFFALKARLTRHPKPMPPDSVAVGISGRLLIISSSMPKPRWSTDTIIGVRQGGVLQGWYELRDDREQRHRGRYVYTLHSIPVPRLTARPYEEYNLPPEVAEVA